VKLACIGAICVVCFAQAQSSRAQSSQEVKNKEVPAFLKQLADTRKTLADSYVHWAEAVKTKNIDAIVGLYRDDATILPEESEAVSGKAGVRTFYTDWLSDGKLVEEKFRKYQFCSGRRPADRQHKVFGSFL
jgi:hypothetical protein